jgi:uncharacterized protein (DUF433 family)
MKTEKIFSMVDTLSIDSKLQLVDKLLDNLSPFQKDINIFGTKQTVLKSNKLRKAHLIEKYFDFLSHDDIRIKGTRIGIESVLYEYIHRDQGPKSIIQKFPNLNLEQIYATILYYLHNKEEIDRYMTDWLEFGRKKRVEQDNNPPPIIIKLRALKQNKQITMVTE